MIEHKKKTCKKGSGKAIGFSGCGSESWKLEYGLCPACLYDFFTQTEPGKVIFEKRKIKVKAKNWKEEKAKMKESVKTLSEYEADAKRSFQKWVRLRDENKPCVSCGNTSKEDRAGGHFYSAGMYSGLMFNPDNCHSQCNTYCNKFLSGNLLQYRKGLINRYGIAFVENLDNLSNELRNYKYTKQELIDIKKKYDLKIKNNDFNN